MTATGRTAPGTPVPTQSGSTTTGAVVNRYKSSPAVGIWEPINEPEATNCTAGFLGRACYSHHPACPVGAATALRSFFDAVGGQIKRLDPKHLVASGVIGSGQCGASGADYATVHASAGIDVATYHDYGQNTTAVPAALTQRLQQTRALSKPLVSEEVGLYSSPNHAVGCVEPAARASLLQHKLAGQFNAGSRGFLVWNYGLVAAPNCGYDIQTGDPAMTLMRTAPR
jgi:mannan endo-1,4-beta-mannosidase